jgi:hypothetical protein
MASMNQGSVIVPLRTFMEGPEGWGRAQGRAVHGRLLQYVEEHPGVAIFHVSLKGVTRIDISFASETVVELVNRYRGSKGFCLVDAGDPDLIENIDAAAVKKGIALMMWQGSRARLIGSLPSEGNKGAFEFALQRSEVRAAEFANAHRGMSIANASTKFKQLWEQGFLLRRESVAQSGGVEYQYLRIG